MKENDRENLSPPELARLKKMIDMKIYHRALATLEIADQ